MAAIWLFLRAESRVPLAGLALPRADRRRPCGRGGDGCGGGAPHRLGLRPFPRLGQGRRCSSRRRAVRPELRPALADCGDARSTGRQRRRDQAVQRDASAPSSTSIPKTRSPTTSGACTHPARASWRVILPGPAIGRSHRVLNGRPAIVRTYGLVKLRTDERRQTGIPERSAVTRGVRPTAVGEYISAIRVPHTSTATTGVASRTLSGLV